MIKNSRVIPPLMPEHVPSSWASFRMPTRDFLPSDASYGMEEVTCDPDGPAKLIRHMTQNNPALQKELLDSLERRTQE